MVALRSVAAGMSRDGALLFTTRVARLFAQGFLSVALVLYLLISSILSGSTTNITDNRKTQNSEVCVAEFDL